MEKKLIAFTDEQLEKINEYSEKYKKTFTESVRRLIEYALKNLIDDEESVSDISERILAVEEEVKKLSWWTSDDNTSRMGNLEVEIEEMKKNINVLTAAMKLFKGHLKDRSIHLQD